MAKRIALIIGNNEYRDPHLHQLAAPEVDAKAVAKVLYDNSIGGFEKVKIEKIEDTDRTIINLEDAQNKEQVVDIEEMINRPFLEVHRRISQLFDQKRKKDDLLLLYFSGHGILDEDGQLYLAVNNTEKELLSATAIPAYQIKNLMDRNLSNRQILILDCCHSGAFARGGKGEIGRSVNTEEAFKGNGSGRIVLTASDATQYAWEGDRLIGDVKGSIFTHYLVRGLETGEADINGNGNVNIDNLYQYVYENVISVGNKQTPKKWSYIPQEGEMIIARNPFFRSKTPKIHNTQPAEQCYKFSAERYGAGYTSLVVTCAIHDNGSATVTRIVEVEAFTDLPQLDTYLLVPEKSPDDNVREINIDKVKSLTPSKEVALTAMKEELAKKSAVITITPRLKASEKITYEMVENLPVGLYAIGLNEEEILKRESPLDYFGWNINRPTKKLTLNVRFPKSYKPTQFNQQVRFASASGFPSTRLQDKEQEYISDPILVTDEDDTSLLSLEIDYPMIGLVYILLWNPTTTNM